MIIKEITLENFRQYRGIQNISFSTDSEKNVTVILGMNTSGKTTIVRAFLWCLYGETGDWKQKDLLNKELTNENGSFEVSVEVVLDHEGKEYHFKRKQPFEVISNGVSKSEYKLEAFYRDTNGITQNIRSFKMQDIIDRILPKDLANYFFFDGEQVETINKRKNVKDSVSNLLGLSIFSTAIDHLDPDKKSSVVSQILDDRDLTQGQNAEKCKNDLEEAKEARENARTEKKESEKEKEYYRQKEEELAEKIKANQEIAQKQKERESIQKDIEHLKEEVKSNEDNIITFFNRNAVGIFISPLASIVLNVVENAKESGEGIPEMKACSIDYILERGTCICGQTINSIEGAKEHLEFEKKLLPPESIGTIVRNFKKDINDKTKNAIEDIEIIENAYTQYLKSKKAQEDKEDDLETISEAIKGQVNVRKLEEEYQEAKEKYKHFEKEVVRLGELFAEQTGKIKQLESDIAGLVVSSAKNDKLNRYAQYATEIYEWFKQEHDEKFKLVKEELLEKVNKNFKAMFHGNRSILMDDNFELTSETVNEWRLDTSKGLDTVINFSFIMGLVELAREKITSVRIGDEEIDISEPYPIVMDAPFSNTDETHIKNITRQLPQVAEQVIIIVMEKDWQIAEETLINKVGKKYRIEKQGNTESYSKIKLEEL